VAEKVSAFGRGDVGDFVHADNAAQGAEAEGLVVVVRMVWGGLLGEDGFFALFAEGIGERGGGGVIGREVDCVDCYGLCCGWVWATAAPGGVG